MHRLLNSRLKRRKITAKYVAGIMVGIICLLAAYLASVTVISEPRVYYIHEQTGHQLYELGKCKQTYYVFAIVLYVVEGMALLVGGGLCWATRNVADEFNESTYIAMCK